MYKEYEYFKANREKNLKALSGNVYNRTYETLYPGIVTKLTHRLRNENRHKTAREIKRLLDNADTRWTALPPMLYPEEVKYINSLV